MTRMSNTKAFLLIGFTVGVIMTALTYEAKAVDGNFLLNQCKGNGGHQTAYIMGVIDALEDTGERRYCLPANSQGAQYKDVVCRGLQNTPEVRHMPASLLTHAFLVEAFPCR